jgi:hypothetical protein
MRDFYFSPLFPLTVFRPERLFTSFEIGKRYNDSRVDAKSIKRKGLRI